MAIQKVTSDLIADNSIGIAQLNLSDGSNGQFLKTNGSGTLSFDTAGGGGGAWNLVATSTVSSTVTSVELTISGYDNYDIRFDKIDPSNRTGGSVAEYIRIHFSTNGGTSYSTNVKHLMRRGETRNTSTQFYNYSGSYSGTNTENYIDLIDNYKSSTFAHSLSGTISLENNVSGQQGKHGQFRVYTTRDYSNALQAMEREGFYSVQETAVINKIKFDFSGSVNMPIGSRFTVWGLSNS